MIILDTSIWADQFRSRVVDLPDVLKSGEVLQHPYVTGELALGNPSDHSALIAFLNALTQAPVLSPGQMLDIVVEQGLGGTGIGYVDAHLLGSALKAEAKLWTHDKRLAAQAARLGLGYLQD